MLLYLLFVSPPVNVHAYDTPDDAGGSITVEWSPPPGVEVKFYEVYRSCEGGPYEFIGKFIGSLHSYVDKGLEDGKKYTYRIRLIDVNGDTSEFSMPSSPAVPSPQWFKKGKLNLFIAVVLYFGFLIFFVQSAKTGKRLFIRRIAGLDALDEAVGRATEMGRPILYVPGLGTMGDVATIASVNILKPVAKKAAEYETPIIVPNRDPIVMTVAQQVVKEAYLEAGRPDAYREDNVFYLTDSQFAYAAGVDGIMMRERPATNLFMGMFYAESLILAETGNMTGAIQIAGTDAVAQLPFFIAACDYTIIGEELYAASAYLSQDPKLVGSLKAQDLGKAILMFLLLLGSILSLCNIPLILNFFRTL